MPPPKRYAAASAAAAEPAAVDSGGVAVMPARAVAVQENRQLRQGVVEGTDVPQVDRVLVEDVWDDIEAPGAPRARVHERGVPLGLEQPEPLERLLVSPYY